MDAAARTTDPRDWLFGRPPEAPSTLLRRHVRISPYFEEDLVHLVKSLGEGTILAGSDYPHPEALAEPMQFADHLEGLPPATVRRIMRDNPADLLGL